MTDSDLMSELRESNPAPAKSLTPSERHRMQQLLNELPRGPQQAVRTRTSRRTAPVIGFSLLGAGALTIALVATNIVGLAGWRGGADSAAASALESAAMATLEVNDPIVGPGQYLLIETSAVTSMTTTDGNGGFTSFLDGHYDELYVPHNRDDDWVWKRYARKTAQTFRPASEAYAAEMHRPSGDELLRASGGAFYGYHRTEINEDYDSLSRDPHQLLNEIYIKTLTQGQSRDGAALGWITDELRTGIVPASLRAALYKAAAQIPGVTITEQQATLDGTTGIAIGRVETSTNIQQDMIIDRTTGQFIGEREMSLEPRNGLPAGVASASTAVKTRVVDVAPEGGTPYGKLPPGDQQ